MVLREAKYYGGRNRDNHMTIKASFHFTSNSKWCSFWNFFQDLPSSKSPPMFYPTWRLKPFSPEAQVSSGQWTSEAQSRTGACTLAQLEYVGIPFRQGSRMIWWYLCLYILVYIYIYTIILKYIEYGMFHAYVHFPEDLLKLSYSIETC